MIPKLLAILLLSQGMILAQDETAANGTVQDQTNQSAAAGVTGSAEYPEQVEPAVVANAPDALTQGRSTFIPGLLEVIPFAPPVPVVRAVPPPVRILASVSFPSAKGTTFTLQRGEPSTEPDLPPPPPPQPYVAPREPTPEETARRLYQRRHRLNLGATIYDHKVSVVNWTDQETFVRYEAVCGFDIGLLAGIGGFVHHGENYKFDLTHSRYVTTAVRRFANQWRPQLPAVPPGEIIIREGDAEDETAIAPLTIVRDVIAAEQDRLIPYQAAREDYFKAAAAWYAAHPPVPRDETFIFSPHRGSRYLPAAKPAQPATP